MSADCSCPYGCPEHGPTEPKPRYVTTGTTGAPLLTYAGAAWEMTQHPLEGNPITTLLTRGRRIWTCEHRHGNRDDAQQCADTAVRTGKARP